MKISKYFTMLECTRSESASRMGIRNTPNQAQTEALKWFMNNCMDKVRELFGVPITPTSVFRSKMLNSLVGGSPTSDHVKGYACDFVIPGVSISTAIRRIVAAGIPFDQIIDEYGSWIHISCKPSGNRRQVLTVFHKGGKSIWKKL